RPRMPSVKNTMRAPRPAPIIPPGEDELMKPAVSLSSFTLNVLRSTCSKPPSTFNQTHVSPRPASFFFAFSSSCTVGVDGGGAPGFMGGGGERPPACIEPYGLVGGGGCGTCADAAVAIESAATNTASTASFVIRLPRPLACLDRWTRLAALGFCSCRRA